MCLAAALEAYSAKRYADAVAICDLAMYNYIEVSLVAFYFCQQPRLESSCFYAYKLTCEKGINQFAYEICLRWCLSQTG